MSAFDNPPIIPGNDQNRQPEQQQQQNDLLTQTLDRFFNDAQVAPPLVRAAETVPVGTVPVRADVREGNDRPAGPVQPPEGDRSLESPAFTPKSGWMAERDPFERTRAATIAAFELRSLQIRAQRENLSDDSQVFVPDNTGGHNETLGRRMSMLQEFIRTQMGQAITLVDAIRQTGENSVESLLRAYREDANKEPVRRRLAEQLGLDPATMAPPGHLQRLRQLADIVRTGNDPNNQRDTLAQQVGLDPRNLTTEIIQAELNKSALQWLDQRFINPRTTAAERTQLRQLAVLQQELEDLNHLRHGRSSVRLQYADILASGMLNPNRAEANNGRPTSAQSLEAYTLVRTASQLDNTREVQNSPEYQALNRSVNEQHSHNQTVRCQQLLELIQTGEQAMQRGDRRRADEIYAQALRESEAVDLRFLRMQLRAQPSEAIQRRVLATIQTLEKVRFDCAKHLVDTATPQNGNMVAAERLLIRVQAEAPWFTNDQVFNNLMSRVRGHRRDMAQPQSNAFFHVMNAQRLITANPPDADEAWREIQRARRAQGGVNSAEIQREREMLTSQRADIERQQRELATRTDLTPAERQEEESMLRERLELTNAFTAMANADNMAAPLITYFDGVVAMLRGDNRSANAWLRIFKNAWPSMAAEECYRTDELIEATRERGWFERNWNSIKRGLVIGAAVIAAVGVAALTFYTGPGAALAGAGTFGLVMAAGGSILAGTAAGTLTYVGGTALSGERVTGRTWLEGIGISATAATAVVAPGVTSSLGLNAAAWSTRLGVAAAITAPQVISHQTAQVVYENKDPWTAVRDGALYQAAGTFGGAFFSNATRVAGYGAGLQIGVGEVGPRTVVPIVVDGYQTYFTNPDSSPAAQAQRRYQQPIANPQPEDPRRQTPQR